MNTKTLRALGMAAFLLTGTALAASAATTIDNQGNTTASSTGTLSTNPPTNPTTGRAYGSSAGTTYGSAAAANGVSMDHGSSPNSNGNPASATPKVDRGSAEAATGGH